MPVCCDLLRVEQPCVVCLCCAALCALCVRLDACLVLQVCKPCVFWSRLPCMSRCGPRQPERGTRTPQRTLTIARPVLWLCAHSLKALGALLPRQWWGTGARARIDKKGDFCPSRHGPAAAAPPLHTASRRKGGGLTRLTCCQVAPASTQGPRRLFCTSRLSQRGPRASLPTRSHQQLPAWRINVAL